jgi:hypothetical protein
MYACAFELWNDTRVSLGQRKQWEKQKEQKSRKASYRYIDIDVTSNKRVSGADT